MKKLFSLLAVAFLFAGCGAEPVQKPIEQLGSAKQKLAGTYAVPKLTQSIFNFAQALTWNSTNESFVSGSTHYYPFVVQDGTPTSGVVKWEFSTVANGGTYSYARISQMSAEVINNGTYHSAADACYGTIEYDGTNWWLTIQRNTSTNVPVMEAVSVDSGNNCAL